MQPEQRDIAYLWDILDAARTILEFTSDVSYGDYLENRMRQLAVEREIEIIGEAARRISEHFKEEHQQIPWRKIIGQRNVLAHDYGEIRQDRMWLVATVNIPELIAQIEPLVPPEPLRDR